MPFLAKFGEWSDIANIIKMVGGSNGAPTRRRGGRLQR
jgi:hypothetical protein